MLTPRALERGSSATRWMHGSSRQRLEALKTTGYTLGMKTAISIPDDVFTEADALARSTGRSRSELYSLAVREYVARHSSDAVTAALDALSDTDLDSDFATSVGASRLSDSEW